ncbi:DUF4097 family beta strand repeat-containing protein [Paenibacillus humicola]|uniref:DUF4097 family beta strand repeat-containing protein n=1 Tax=Paenibacillus humicola TaxID=3110540 RepID=UPI00237B9318|nr:DUF4097 family beta strand repeat-containing protein [Paenibacillus humicola]
MNLQQSKSRLLAPVLAFFVPGAGHLALGLHLKGLLLLIGTLTDIVAMVRFADDAGGKYALLLVLLGLALPAFWFYSVFDTLQQRAHLNASPYGGRQDRTPAAGTWLQGATVIAAGLLLLALVRAKSIFTPWLDLAGTYAPGAGLLAFAVLLAVWRGKTMYRMGRITAAIVLIAVGGLLLSDQIRDSNDIRLLGQWWPAAFVLLGLEVIGCSLANRRGTKRLTFDIGGVFIAVVVTAAAYTVTQYSAMPFKWLDEFKVNFAGNLSVYGEEKGFKYTKETVSVPFGAETASIDIDNPNGTVTIRKGEVSGVQIASVVWVDVPVKQTADQVAAESGVEASGGDKLKIEAKGKTYGEDHNRKPRINLVVTVPENSSLGRPTPPENNETSGTPDSSIPLESSDNGTLNSGSGSNSAGGENANPNRAANEGSGTDNAGNASVNSGANEASNSSVGSDTAVNEASNSSVGSDEKTGGDQPVETKLNVQISNGAVDISGLSLPGGVHVQLMNGEAKLDDIAGDINVETKNGGISVSGIRGAVKLETYNGAIKAGHIEGDVDGSTLSGDMTLNGITGNAELETKNGKISVSEASGSISADTLNGDITIRSAVVGGDWDTDSSIGEIHLFVPENGDFSVNGSVTFGTITTDLPLEVSKKKIGGTLGTGTYRIDVDANSSISINRYRPN